MKPETLERINTQITKHREAIQTVRNFEGKQDSLFESIKKLVIIPLEASLEFLEDLKKTEALTT